MIRTKSERRKVNFIFNPEGGIGKLLTIDYITLDPEFNALLVLQLQSSKRWVAAFMNQIGHVQ